MDNEERQRGAITGGEEPEETETHGTEGINADGEEEPEIDEWAELLGREELVEMEIPLEAVGGSEGRGKKLDGQERIEPVDREAKGITSREKQRSVRTPLNHKSEKEEKGASISIW